MKSILKLSFAVPALMAFVSLVPRVHAQGYSLQATSLNGGTNNVATATTNSTFAVIITPTRANNVAIQTTFKLDGAGTDSIVFKWDHSVDGSNWKTAGTSITVTANGTNNVTDVTNVSLGGIGYLRLRTVQNPSSSSVTNLVVKYSSKPGL